MMPLSPIEDAVMRRVPILNLREGSKVLAAPCCTGALQAALEEAGFEVWTAGAEPCAGRHFVVADLSEALPWPEATFDGAFAVEGIERVENRFRFLGEIYRVLRPGGIFLLTTPNITSVRSRVRFLGSGFFSCDPRPLNETERRPSDRINLATFADLRYALHTTGFVLRRAGATHVRKSGLIYAPLALWMWLYTSLTLRKEPEPLQRERNRAILRTLASPPVLFGENLLLIANKP
jgi:SAM-dependent methyltransferase